MNGLLPPNAWLIGLIGGICFGAGMVLAFTVSLYFLPLIFGANISVMIAKHLDLKGLR